MFLTACGLALGNPGDAPESTYHTTVAEVQLTFSATDQNDHGIATLQAGDFAIVDTDRIVRHPRSFQRAEFTRLELVILVDASGSIRTQLPREIANVTWFVNQTQGVPEENFSIVSFQRQRPTLACAGNCRTGHASGQLPARPEGLTPLYDSVVFAVDLLAQRADAHARKVLILLSDGEDTISQHAAADALQAAMANEIQIYAVATASSSSGGESVLRRFANATGGRYYTVDDAGKVLNAVLEDFHATYTVTYQLPSRAAGYHNVRILPTHNLNLTFRCQGGYYYPGTVR
ncbi:MAG: VWA domain-containing protein [Acidobacteriia bacterium]|nr:VWA domain-containing protein [Terriglobia bacterium]